MYLFFDPKELTQHGRQRIQSFDRSKRGKVGIPRNTRQISQKSMRPRE